MTKLKIPHNAFVFVGDGRKALFLRNEGDEKFPNLKALDSGQRSAVEPIDWHHIEEHRFAKKVAAAMEQVVRARKVPALAKRISR